MRERILILGFMLLAGIFYGQKSKIEISVSSNQVSTAETFNMMIILTNGDGIESISSPKLDAFQVFGEPSQSRSNNISIVNGKRTRVSTFTYTYRLKAKREGRFSIEPVTATGPGKEIKSNRVTIEVVKGTKSGNPVNGSNSNKQMFVTAEVNKRNVVIGEPIVVSYMLYLRSGNMDEVEKLEIPQNPGFWKEEIEVAQNWETKLLNGVRYNVVEVQRHLLFPQKSGDLEIGSFELTGLIGSGGWFNHRRERASSKSRPVTIKVSPLPPGKPSNFLGTFESLSMTDVAKPQEVKAHEAIDYKITFDGRGNMKLINAPIIEFPTDFEVYDPKVNDRINIGKYFMSGRRTFEYLVIPKHEGDFILPKVRYSYYNYKEKKYKYLTSPEKRFHILAGEENGNQNYTFNSKTEVNVLNQDIRYIKTDVDSLTPKDELFFGSTKHYALLGFPLLIFLGFFLVKKRNDAILDNPESYKMNKAGKVAKKHLAKAKSLVNQGKSNEFYEAISIALFGYLQDKFGISMSEMSKENIRVILVDKGMSSQAIDQLISTIETCEIARYAPTTTASEDAMYSQAERVIMAMEVG